MLDSDLAELYGVETGALNRAVRRNIEIMRAFVRIKNSESENRAVWQKFDDLEKKYDANFGGVFEAIRRADF